MSYERRRGLGGRGRGRGGDEDDAKSNDGAGRRSGGSGSGQASTRAPSRRRALISAGAVIGALVAGYAVAALWIFPGSASAEDASVIRIPDVVGLAQDEARERILEAGLEMEVAGGLRVDGQIQGTVIAKDDSSSTVVVSESGDVEGTLSVPHVIAHGREQR